MYTINELRHKVFQCIYGVYEIFVNFFGEEFTDLQSMPKDRELVHVLQEKGCTQCDSEHWEVSDEKIEEIKQDCHSIKAEIIIHWPEVTVTNEYNRSINIQDLFAKVDITMEGTIPWENKGFLLTRSTFDRRQYLSGYLHSHIMRFSGVPQFSGPCLGRGPIINTIQDLKRTNEELVWMLFCQELSLYVTVESLTGIPYIKMEEVNDMIKYPLPSEYDDLSLIQRSQFNRRPPELTAALQRLKEFTAFYIRHGHLSFNYKNGCFVPGMPYYDYIVDVSNAFIEWFNQNGSQEELNNLFSTKILEEVVISDGIFYSFESNRASNIINIEGRKVLSFKGEDIKLKILRQNDIVQNVSTILRHNAAMMILNNILKIINYRYRNEHNRANSKQDGRAESSTAQTYRRVLYI